MKTQEVEKIVTHIEENLRASVSAGLDFVDSRHSQSRLLSKQNHVVFGRRGAGKTSLVSSIETSDDHIDIYLNLEDYKDITFPNIVIYILVELFKQLQIRVRSNVRFWRFRPKARRVNRKVGEALRELEVYIYEPDEEVQQVSTSEAHRGELSASANAHGLSGGGRFGKESSQQISRSLPKQKIDHLRLQLTKYKGLVVEISELLNSRPVYLVMDDFYFVVKDVQPDLIDYFHRLTKGTELFLKIATIKHRSKIYKRTSEQYIGVEMGHDVFEIDMDYTLDSSEELQEFMQQLLSNAIKQSGARMSIDDIFAGDGFSQLCLASGGVPRDFLSLFVKLANGVVATGRTIGKVQVNEASITNMSSKMDSMKRDSGDEDAILENCIRRIKKFVYFEKRTNAFLVARDDLDQNEQARQAIRELVDLRLIHLVDDNISHAPSDGRRYEAYILDVGLYDNSRPRNFDQVEPGQRDERARKDKLRASPVFNLAKLEEPIPELPVQLELLTVSEE